MGNLAAITRTDGAVNPAGAKLKLKINFSQYINTWPTFVASPSTDTELVSVDADFVSPTASPFKEWAFIPNTTAIRSKKQGASHLCETEGEVFIPNSAEGITAEAQIVRAMNSSVALLIYLQNGAVKLGGENEARPARLVEVNWDSKKVNEDGTVSMMIKFEWVSIVPGGANFTGDTTVV